MAYPRQSLELSSRELIQLTRAFFRSPTDSGEMVRQFESAFARLVGIREAVSFASQRAGMYALLKTLDPREGDEVMVPAYTFFSVPACVVLAGLRPVFVDVDPDTWNLDPSQVKAAVTKRTRAMIVTHLNGCPAELESLVQMAHDSKAMLIEDCAQALGASYRTQPVGSFGVGCFSFGEGKNLFALGGGMITTDDASLAQRLRTLKVKNRSVGHRELSWKIVRALLYRALTLPSVFTFTAFPLLLLASFWNGKVDTEREHTLKGIHEASFDIEFSNAQAALGLAQLEQLERRNQRRMDNARWLTEALHGLEGVTLPPQPSDGTHLYLHYPVRVEDRESFVHRLIQRGVDAQRDYCSYCPALPDFQKFVSNATKTPVAKELAGNVAYLPNFPSLDKSDMLQIARCAKNVLAS